MITKRISLVESKRALYKPETIFVGNSNPFKILLYIYVAPSTKRCPGFVETLIDSAVMNPMR